MLTTKPAAAECLTITADPIASGKERSCFLHPQDPAKIVKISTGGEDTQSRREIVFYRELMQRREFDYSHLPRFYGVVETNLGPGLVLDLICDADGRISRSLQWYLENGLDLAEAESLLRDLKKYLLDNLVIFNHDLFSGNLLLQKSADDNRLIMIDGLGDVVSIRWLNRFPSHARGKIERRWKRLMTRFYNNKYVVELQKSAR